jgi:2-hydroxy-3-keto-5-methylthiopentenyl-1-phosphate phosphatase
VRRPRRLDPRRVHVFSDFDGTITARDTLVFLGHRLGAGPSVQRANERLLHAGRMTLRGCIEADMRGIRAPFTEAARLLRAHVPLDPSFPRFARWCAARGVRLTVLSGGFREIVGLYLPPAEFPGLEIRANRLLTDGRAGWRCVFRDRSPFGHDKARALREARRRGRHAVFIGDGLSDHAPAEVADEVFAKNGLAAWCRERGIRHREMAGFDAVLASLAARFGPR